MATFHFAVQSIGRATGRSAVAAAAYRRCTRMEDQRTGQAHDYRAKSGHVAGGLVGWAGELADLWNAAETAERHPRAVLAREVLVALPRDLDDVGRQRLVESLAAWLRDRHGVAVQWDIHRPDRPANSDNPHAHLLLTSRVISGDGSVGAKTRDLDKSTTSSAHIQAWRAEWERLVNAELATAGLAARVDARSLRAKAKALGHPIAPEPMERLGPSATAMERRGRRTAKGDRNRRRRARNIERAALVSKWCAVGTEELRDQRRRLREQAIAAVEVFRDQSVVHPRPVLDRALAYRAMIDAARAAWPTHWPRALGWLLRRTWPVGWRVAATVGERLRDANRLSRGHAQAAALLARVLKDGMHECEDRERCR